MAKPLTRTYQNVEPPIAQPGSQTFLTGIRGVTGDKEKMYISGVYRDPKKVNNGFIYDGDLKGKGTWYMLNYPSGDTRTVTGTSLYGPSNWKTICEHDKQITAIQTVGNYTTKEAGEKTFGCLYQGTLKGDGKWFTLIPPSKEKIIGVIAHSVMGCLIVGNYDVEFIKKSKKAKVAKSVTLPRAFIYDIEHNRYYKIKVPDSISATAYGVWQDDADNYTICGGYTRLLRTKTGKKPVTYGYIVKFNKKELNFSYFKSYQFEEYSSSTHFNGITSDGKQGYNLTGDAVTRLLGPKHPKPIVVAFFAHINDITKDPNWEIISYPNSKTTSGNSVYQKTIVGIYTDSKENENAYISY
jgi:hypothetical protein